VTSPVALTLGAQAESEQAERDRLAAAHERACWRAEYAHLLHDVGPGQQVPRVRREPRQGPEGGDGMSARLWLSTLPSTNPAFGPLHQAESMLQEHLETDWQPLERGHMQAVSEAARGADFADLDKRAESLRAEADRLREQSKRAGGEGAAAVHRAELESLGYALGVTAVRVAVRVREQAGMGVAA
jgi:hypothetical protein